MNFFRPSLSRSPLVRVSVAVLSAITLCVQWTVVPAVSAKAHVAKRVVRDTKVAQNVAVNAPLFHPTDQAFISKFLHQGEYMPTSQIKPGMVGYGLTVFQGNKIERFNVRIISVLKKVLNGRDAILARLSGGEMGKNCVIKGMSGSPCYINGKLIGAVSFGFDFEKEPIAGITPIVDMLDALVDVTPDDKASIAHLSGPAWSKELGTTPGLMNTSGAAPRLVPLVSPVSLVGFSSRAESFLAEKFKSIGLGVASGAAGALDPQLATVTDKDLKPGSAVCVLLATGDFNIAATGTVTARFGNKMVGFGHPFMQGGSIDFPMATAYVHQVLPSLAVSFKMASPVSVVGSVVADRPWGIGGRMGRKSHTIPAQYTVIDETRHIERTYNCQVIDHPEMTPAILAATATSAVDATHQSSGPYVARVETKLEADGIDPIVRTDRFATGLSSKSIFDLLLGGDPIGRFVQKSTDQICNNDFQKASIKRLTMKIVIQDGHKTAKIDRVYVDKSVAAPGDEVQITAILKPFNGEPRPETISFEIPRDMPDGNMVIGVAGGQEYDSLKTRLGIVDPEPENLKQIAKNLQDDGRGDQIALVVALPEQSLMVSGTKLTNPPAYWTKVFISNRHTKGPTLVKGELKKTKDFDRMLFGSHIIAVEVRSPDKAAAKQAPYPLAAPFNNDDVAVTEQAKKAMESFPSPRKGAAARGSGSSGSSGATQNTTPEGSGAAVAISTGTGASTAAAASTAGKSAPAATMLTASTGKDYPHVRPLQIWRQDSDEDFRPGKLEDATVDSWGRLSPGLESTADKQVSTEDQIWSSTLCQSQVYYGSGDEVWRWHGDKSAPERVAKLEGLFIPAMTANKNVVYAAAVPSGHIYAIDTNGGSFKPKVFATLQEPIITSLAVDNKDNLYAGVAGTGKVYKIDPSGRATLLIDSGQAHVLSLFFCQPEDRLYIGTGEKGAVYSVDKSGKVRAIYQSADQFVTGVVKDKKGDLYIATAGQGHLVRVSAQGEPVTLASSEAFYKLHYDAASDSVFSGDAEGDITMACLDPQTRQPYFMPVCHTEQEAVIALASDGKNLYAGTSNLAQLRAFSMQLSSKSLYTSAVKDGGRTANWSRLHALGPFNDVNKAVVLKLKVETRTGETARPDDTWSKWEKAAIKDDSFAVESPPGRYFQYRLSWDTTQDKFSADKVDTLTLGRIDTTFLPINSAPQLSTISVKSGSAVSRKQEVSVTGTDADGDNLLCSIDISSDGGATWKSLKDEIRSKAAKKEGKGAFSVDDDDDEANATDTKDEAQDKSDKDADKSKEEASTSKDLPADATKDKDDKGGVAPNDSHSTDKKDESKSDSAQKTSTSYKGFFNLKVPRFTRLQLPPNNGMHPQDEPGDKAEPKHEDKGKDAEHKEAPKVTAVQKAHKKVAKKKSTAHISVGGANDSKTAESTGASTETFTYDWDTKKQKDGHYLLRFTVDDRVSNQHDHQQVVNLRSVVIDNTAPEIELIDCKRQGDGKIEFTVKAQDKLTPIANAIYRIDQGEPFALTFQPETIDGLHATLTAQDVKIKSGEHKLEVKVSDRAGNAATKSITIK